MNVSSRRIAGFAAAFGLLVSVGLTSASATTTTYKGTLTFGRQTAHINCTGSPATPTSITYTVAYDATHWNTSASMTATGSFGYYSPDINNIEAYSTPVPVTIQAGQAATITVTLNVPANAQSVQEASVGLGGPGQLVGPALTFPGSCASPVVPSFRVPTIGTITHPCLGLTTVSVTNGSSLVWAVTPVVEPASSTGGTPPVKIPAGATRTIAVGRALQGAEHFYLWAYAANGSSYTSTYADVPLILYSRACIRGHVSTSLAAVHSGTTTKLTVTERPILPKGTAVKFYRIVGKTRTYLGMATTSTTGHAILTVPYRTQSTYVAVVGATHYSYSTTTPTAYVN